jgi:hypothetical protein
MKINSEARSSIFSFCAFSLSCLTPLGPSLRSFFLHDSKISEVALVLSRSIVSNDLSFQVVLACVSLLRYHHRHTLFSLFFSVSAWMSSRLELVQPCRVSTPLRNNRSPSQIQCAFNDDQELGAGLTHRCLLAHLLRAFAYFPP